MHILFCVNNIKFGTKCFVKVEQFVLPFIKGTVNNLFDEEYLSVLSRPMPGISFEFFIGITPKWGKKKK